MFGRSTVVAKKQEKHKNSLDNSRKIGNTQMQAQFASQKKKSKHRGLPSLARAKLSSKEHSENRGLN
jgi:hypothetical protein